MEREPNEIQILDGRSEKRYVIPDVLRERVRGDGWTAYVEIVPGDYRPAFARVEIEFDEPVEPKAVQRVKWGVIAAEAVKAGGRRPRNLQESRRWSGG